MWSTLLSFKKFSYLDWRTSNPILIKIEIQNLRRQKQSLQKELEIDRKNLAKVRQQLVTKEEKQRGLMDRVNALEERKEAYEAIISKGEEAYEKMVMNSGKLVTCIENYCKETTEKHLTVN